MLSKINKAITYLEHQSFGICSYWGDIWGISSGKIRIFFIYASFIAKGSPVIIYMSLGFLMNIKKYYRIRRNTIWDL